MILYNLAMYLLGYSIQLAWDASPDQSVTGYKVYYGTTSRNYSSSVTVGNFLSVNLAGLNEMRTYFISATAYNSSGLESDFSNEISFTKPCTLKITKTQNGPSQVITISTDVYAGMQFSIEGSADLKTWNTVYSGTAATNSISIPFNPIAPVAFYRLKKSPTSPKALSLLKSVEVIPPLTYKEPTKWEMRRWKIRNSIGEKKGGELLMNLRKPRYAIKPPPLRALRAAE